MGGKKRKANKKKRQNFNKTKSNSNELKSSPTKSVDSNATSPCLSDFQRFLISDSEDSVSITSSQDIDCPEAVYWNRNFFEESNTDNTSIFESLADNVANISLRNKASLSGVTVSSKEERKVTEYAYFQTSGKTNTSKAVTITRTENIENEISSTDGEVGSLNKATVDSLCPDAIDYPKSSIVINARNEFESLNNIESRCRDSTDPSTSMAVNGKEDPQSPICPTNNSAVSLTDDVTNSQNQPNFKGNDRLNCSPICINNASVTITNTKGIGNAIISTGDNVESLNNITTDFLSQDAIDCVESTVFSNANNVLESLNNIDSLCRDSTDPSTSVVVIKGNQHSLVCHSNNSSVSLTGDVIESQNSFISEGINRLNCSTVGINNGSKLSSKPSDINVLSSTDSSSREITSSHSESTQVCTLDSSSVIAKKCEDVVVLHISREVDLQERIIGGQEWIREMHSWLENSRSFIEMKYESRYFRKVKRNACINSIYNKIIKEFFECSKNYVHQVKEISKFYQENCEIQLRKLTEILETYEECVSNTENRPFDEISISHKNVLAITKYTNFNILDNLRERYINEKLPMVKQYVKQIESIIERFFKYI